MSLSIAGRRALKQSIRKWKDILYNGGEDKGTRNCALCQHYRDLSSCTRTYQYGRQETCPVAEYSNAIGCEKSPYGAWATHQRYEHSGCGPWSIQCPICADLAQQELEFLEFLWVHHRCQWWQRPWVSFACAAILPLMIGVPIAKLLFWIHQHMH